MALTETYLTTTKNLRPFFDALRAARAPEKFTLKFLEDLGFKSTNDRLFIGLLKALRLLDENSAPTKRYFAFLDDGRWKQVLAEGIRDAYEDLFRLNKRADTLPRQDIHGKFKSLTEGKKSDAVMAKFLMTFIELVKLADFSSASPGLDGKQEESAPAAPKEQKQVEIPDEPTEHPRNRPHDRKRLIDGLSYRIEIVLPAVRDQSVYDAIFRSLKEHLL